MSKPVNADATSAKSRRTAGRWFYVIVILLVLLLNIVSFVPSIIDASTRTVPLPLTSIDLAHAFVSAAWLLAVLAQVTLVAAGRPSVHRRLGIVGVLLSATLIVVTWFMLVEGARRGFDLSGDLVPRGTVVDPGTFLAPANALGVIGVLIGIAVWYRQRPAVHKRLMMLAILTSTGAPIAHMVGHWPALRPYPVINPIVGVAPATTAGDPRPSIGASHPPRVVMGRDWRVCLGDIVLHCNRADVCVARFRGLDCSVRKASECFVDLNVFFPQFVSSIQAYSHFVRQQ